MVCVVNYGSYNTVRILSRVVEGRARRRHSNRFTLVVNAGANSRPAFFNVQNVGSMADIKAVKSADGADKIAEGKPPWRLLP